MWYMSRFNWLADVFMYYLIPLKTCCIVIYCAVVKLGLYTPETVAQDCWPACRTFCSSNHLFILTVSSLLKSKGPQLLAVSE